MATAKKIKVSVAPIIDEKTELSELETLVSLQRKWRLVHPDQPIPDNLEQLKVLIPSGLTDKEIFQFLRGSLEEAKYIWLTVFNTSNTKEHLKNNLILAGIPNALQVFDGKTRSNLEGAIKFLPD